MSKYHNRRTERGGITFASKAEATRYSELSILEASGVITCLKVQPRYTLQEKFTSRETGCKVRAIEYVGDFQYIDAETGQTICEDVKGVETPVFKLKQKMFLKVFWWIDLRVLKG